MSIPELSYVKYLGTGRNYRRDSNGRAVGTKKKYIALHNTSNSAPAKNEASYGTRRTDSVSSHFYVDDVEAYQSLPTEWVAWHAGSNTGNSYAVAIEITGTNATNNWLGDPDDIDMAARITADECKKWGISNRLLSVAEMKAGNASGIVTHNNMRLAWGGTDHTDPGSNFPYAYFMAKVAEYLGTAPPVVPGNPSYWVPENGMLDSRTTKRLQGYMGTPVDGVITQPPGRSSLVKRLQEYLNTRVHAGLVVDGQGLAQDGRSYLTVKALQKYLGTTQDGKLSTPSQAIKELQRRLNNSAF